MKLVWDNPAEHSLQNLAADTRLIEIASRWQNEVIRLGFSITEICSSRSGAIMIWATNGTHELDILIEPPFAVSLACEHDDKVIHNAYRAIPDQALRAFTAFAEKISRRSRRK